MNFRPKITKTKNADGSPVDQPRVEHAINYMVPISELITFQVDQDLYEAMTIMISQKISGAPVLDENGAFVGILSEKDCLEILFDVVYNQQEKLKTKVKDYMSKDVVTVKYTANVLEMAERFIHSSYRRFPIVDEENKLIGQISRRDILRAALAMKV